MFFKVKNETALPSPVTAFPTSQREGGLDVLDVGKTSDKVSSDRIAKQHLPTKNDEGPPERGSVRCVGDGPPRAAPDPPRGRVTYLMSRR